MAAYLGNGGGHMLLRRRLAVLAMSAALVTPVVFSTAPALGAPAQYAKLYITPSLEQPGYYNVVVSGHFNTTARQATVGMRLKGDDPVFNDDLGISATGRAFDGDFSISTLAPRTALNEDPEGRDEIFAYVSSSTGWSTNTPNVYGYY
jgi:hypothetical protein